MFEDVTVQYNEFLALDHVTAKIPRNSSTAIIGPNGAGKTTLLLALLQEVFYQGKIILHGQESKYAKVRIGYVPQRFQFDRGIPITVVEFLVAGWQRLPLWLGIQKQYREKAMNLLEAVQASHLAFKKLGTLSGGELQRVLLACALGKDPELLILDEPGAGIDIQGGHLLCELLEQLRHQYGFTQLMVTHDLSTVTHHATHVICLNRRVIAEGSPAEVLTGPTLMELFGLHMGLVNKKILPLDSGHCISCCSSRKGES
ncbi:MAG: metal ABC transporter ATP-binding protein [Candidatus Bathyarchaeia archaeon]